MIMRVDAGVPQAYSRHAAGAMQISMPVLAGNVQGAVKHAGTLSAVLSKGPLVWLETRPMMWELGNRGACVRDTLLHGFVCTAKTMPCQCGISITITSARAAQRQALWRATLQIGVHAQCHFSVDSGASTGLR